jgi:hypothetical protein
MLSTTLLLLLALHTDHARPKYSRIGQRTIVSVPSETKKYAFKLHLQHPQPPQSPITPFKLLHRRHELFFLLFFLLPILPNPINNSIPHPQHRTIEPTHQPLDELEAAFEQDVLAREVVLVCFGADVVRRRIRRRGRHVFEERWDEGAQGFGCVAFACVGWDGRDVLVLGIFFCGFGFDGL